MKGGNTLVKLEKFVCLKAVQGLGQTRSLSAVLHLLNGKKSIQTIQDSYLYSVQYLYNIFSEENVDCVQVIQQLENGNFIVIDNQQAFLTNNGRDFLQENEEHFQYLYELKPFLLQKQARVFLPRLILTIQLLSNTAANTKRFLPVITNRNIQAWVKNFYYKSIKENNVRGELYNELYSILKCSTEEFADIFVDSLTGSNHYGATRLQSAMKVNMTEIEFSVWWSLHIQKLIEIMKEERYPILSEFCQIEEMTITTSANKTYDLLTKGYSVDEISNIRKLKRPTIEDHIIEIAYVFDNFPYEMYIFDKQYNEIIESLSSMDTIKLGEVKGKVNKEITYFQIRLALAKWVKYDSKK